MYPGVSSSGLLAAAWDPNIGADDAPAPGLMDLAVLPDERVTPLALAGDREAWNVLVKRHERSVLLRLLARGVRVDRAKDILQDTWARLIQQQREGRLDRLDLPGLAIRQAAYLAMEDARAQSKTVPIDDAPEVLLLSDPDPSIEERLASRADLDRAEEPGTPHTEAAKRAGISVQRVRQTLCEVRTRLRAAMERSDESS